MTVGVGTAEVLRDVEPRAEELEERRRALDVLVEALREAIQMDGGDLELVDCDLVEGIVHVRLTGACSSCAISSTTLAAGVRRMLTERLDWVRDVVGDVDTTIDADESAALGRGSWQPR